MARALKIVAWLTVAALGLSLICIALFVGFFNPNDYKVQLEQWVEQQTGRNFTLDGDLQWRLWPNAWPSVALTLPQAHLAASPKWIKQGETEQAFAEWQYASLSVRLWPLLQRRLEFGVLSLRGLRVRLQRDAQGNTNWQDLAQLWATGGEPGRWQFERLDGLQWQDVELSFDDQRTLRHSRLQLTSLRSDALRFAQPIALQVDGVVHSETSVDYLHLPFKLAVRVQVDTGWQQLHLQALQGTAELSCTGFGSIAAQQLPLSIKITDLHWLGAAAQLQAKRLELQVADAQVVAAFNATQLNATPQLDVAVQVSIPKLRDGLQRLGIPVAATRDATVLQSLQATVQVSGTTQHLQLQLPQLQLDQTHLTGEGSWQQHETTHQYFFKLHADQLNLDRYLPIGRAATSMTRRADKSAVSTPLPIAWLRDLQAQGQLQIDRAQLQGIRADNLTLDLDGRGI